MLTSGDGTDMPLLESVALHSCAVVVAACVTVNVRPATLMVPVRSAVVVFAATLYWIVPFPVPEPPLTMLIQDAPLVAVHAHAIEPATVTDPVEPVAGTVTDTGESVIAHPWPACVTVACCPPIVSVAVRSAFVLFAATLKKTDPLPVPLAPEVIVIHDAVFVVVHWQPAPAVTVMPLKAIPGVSAMLAGESDTLQPGAACVTANCRPPTVSDAVRDEVPVLAVME
jgi:hypothetical protein